MAETHIYERKYLAEASVNKELFLVGKKESLEIDKKDQQILSLLAKNARIQTIDIAKKTNLNVKTVLSRIKRMEKQEIIQGYKIFLNLNKIGYQFYKAFISIDKYSEKEYKSILEFCKNHPHIIHLVENVGSWELEPEMEVRQEQDYYNIINELKERFPTFIKNIKTIKIIHEHKAIYSPRTTT